MHLIRTGLTQIPPPPPTPFRVGPEGGGVVLPPGARTQALAVCVPWVE